MISLEGYGRVKTSRKLQFTVSYHVSLVQTYHFKILLLKSKELLSLTIVSNV